MSARSTATWPTTRSFPSGQPDKGGLHPKTGGVREVFVQHLPSLPPFVHRRLRPVTGGGEVFIDDFVDPYDWSFFTSSLNFF